MADEAETTQETTASSTWSRMLAGNRRFAEGKPTHPWQDKETRESLIDTQNPDAAVLCCSDSRVPPEIIFDAGLGDMFVARTAGEMLDPAVLQTLEMAVTDLKVSLLVVLGHQHCAAVAKSARALDALVDRTMAQAGDQPEDTRETLMENLDEIIEASDDMFLKDLGMSVWQARMAGLEDEDDYEQVQIARTIEQLVTHSETIRQALADERLMIVGARYRLDSGLVEVLSF
ncbi:MAG: carbonic anhydrase [Bifidobacterium sp.]|nr:carbonic anhydrase [Bifidobacterium sp.]